MKKSFCIAIAAIVVITIFGAFAYAVTNGDDDNMAKAGDSSKLSDTAGTTEISTTIVDVSDKKYSYSNMVTDIKKLTATYPEILKSEVVGKSVDDRDLYCLIFGNPDAEKQVFITAGIHAREYINPQVVMKMVERYCKCYDTNSYKGVKYSKLFDEICFYIMPMTNPDGIAISQFGPSAIDDVKLRAKVKSLPRNGKYSNWKANANGVDINRNFTYYKSTKPSVTKPCSEKYPGKKAFNQPETRAIRDTLASLKNPVAIINYHSMGNVIYWGYNQTSMKKSCTALKNLFVDMTGYSTIFENAKAAESGIGDFCGYIKNEYKVPYVTVENGSGSVPVDPAQFGTIYKRNKLGFAKVAYMFK